MNDKKTYGYPCTSAAYSIIVNYIDLVLPISAPRLTQLREHLSARSELVGSSSGPTSNQGGKIMLVVIWDPVSARMLPSLGGDVKPLVLSPSSLNKRFRGKIFFVMNYPGLVVTLHVQNPLGRDGQGKNQPILIQIRRDTQKTRGPLQI